jgi:hypothetical protein
LHQPAEAQIAAFLRRLKDAVRKGRVVISVYAAERAADELGWDQADILLMLHELTVSDFRRSETSIRDPADLIWVFCPEVDYDILWIRLIERQGILVVSFHRA